ncbi:GGDEF domain-containing protein [Hydrogenimonas thermophila]|uniref:Diguanylate cyclase (GGDEF) domain-containing protein n=1 Tax=Hydrogenimonas thermophila TaxID=223786 RepID=A0A1I5MXD1_9BACT|nr:bifunctional diguanylate cyclase/phosphodiesterase [Hydrogenimonas thermophila]SFP14132.1 diguanylate cyclase (GGDEF) domain-containing protein [Hydrogenimonas thermophila]
MEELEQNWINYLKKLDIAFQPIVCVHSGNIYGVEALLRGVDKIGFNTIADFFDSAYQENILYTLDLALREKVIRKFTSLKDYDKIKLFINIDNRLFEMPDFSGGNTQKLLEKFNLDKEMLCFEISEQHAISNISIFEKVLTHYKNESYSIAVDDFGVGVSGFQMLYRSTPKFIKIDRFFIDSIHKDFKKKILVQSIVQLSIQLGITVIAEGIETEKEVLVCKELGCHLAQGYFVQRPQLDTNKILKSYEHIIKVSHPRFNTNREQIKNYLEKIEPIVVTDRMNAVLERFKKSRDPAIPVINKEGKPLGILDEEKLKSFVSSPYGRSLLINETEKMPKVKKYIIPYAVVDINSNMNQIVESFSNYKEAKGIIITKAMKYYGFLSASNIISIINERNLVSARDQNPLTRMPGNHQIDRYINDTLAENRQAVMSYFDLNNFKAYNDTYGFRQGDRVIQLFSDILNKNLPKSFFKGHIGGDDFFAGVLVNDENFEEIVEKITFVVNKFKQDVLQMYDKKDREAGYIIAKDREGNVKKFDLLSVSAVVICIYKNSQNRSLDFIHKCFASQKKAAKADINNINVSSIL